MDYQTEEIDVLARHLTSSGYYNDEEPQEDIIKDYITVQTAKKLGMKPWEVEGTDIESYRGRRFWINRVKLIIAAEIKAGVTAKNNVEAEVREGFFKVTQELKTLNNRIYTIERNVTNPTIIREEQLEDGILAIKTKALKHISLLNNQKG